MALATLRLCFHVHLLVKQLSILYKLHYYVPYETEGTEMFRTKVRDQLHLK